MIEGLYDEWNTYYIVRELQNKDTIWWRDYIIKKLYDKETKWWERWEVAI